MAFELQDGQGTFFRNDKKEEGSKQPDYRGEVNIGGTVLDIAGWIKEGKRGKWMSLKVQEKREQQEPAKKASAPDSDIPF